MSLRITSEETECFSVTARRIVARAEGPVFERGTGNGSWALRIHEAGGSSIAADTNLWRIIAQECDEMDCPVPWFPVEPCKTHHPVPPNQALMICWPDSEQGWAFDALLGFQGAPSSTSVSRPAAVALRMPSSHCWGASGRWRQSWRGPSSWVCAPRGKSIDAPNAPKRVAPRRPAGSCVSVK